MSQAIGAVRIIDTHEHIPLEQERNKRELSLFNLLHYVSSDMWAAGLERGPSDRLFDDASVPLDRKWALMAPYWSNVRNTAYSRALLRAVRDLYDAPDISESTYRELSAKIRQANRPGWYREVMQRRAGIDLAICDIGWAGAQLDPGLFRAVIRFDEFAIGITEGIERRSGMKIQSVTDLEGALEKYFAEAREKGFVGIKCALAYNRTLDFGTPDKTQAEAQFPKLRDLIGRRVRPDLREFKPFQDYMLDRIADGCARHNLPLQIHTGLFYDTNRDIRQANPALLIPFVIRHPKTRFLLMHGGYPYSGELLAMAKNLPNVYIDMCWTYIISPSFAERVLNEAIEAVPADKVLGFGGDYQFPEGAYGHAALCREAVTNVVAGKVVSGYWTEPEALAWARAALRENAMRVFHLGGD
jgi:hypothetical protein